MAEAFLLQKRVSGCTDATIRAYRFWLDRVRVQVGCIDGLDSVAMTRFFARLRARSCSPSTIHQAEQGNLTAVDRVLHIMERRAKLLGLDTLSTDAEKPAVGVALQINLTDALVRQVQAIPETLRPEFHRRPDSRPPSNAHPARASGRRLLRCFRHPYPTMKRPEPRIDQIMGAYTSRDPRYAAFADPR